MKQNTSNTKHHIISALNSLPQNHVMEELKSYLRKALNEVERIESKRQRQANTQVAVAEEWKEKIKQHAANSQQPLHAIQVLEKMIEEEQNKLKKPEPKSTNTTTLID